MNCRAKYLPAFFNNIFEIFIKVRFVLSLLKTTLKLYFKNLNGILINTYTV